MSLKYRILVESGDLPKRFVVKVGYWSRLVFDNVKDATRCFEAVSKALGRIDNHTFEQTMADGAKYSASKECIKPLGDDVTLTGENVGTEGEVLCYSLWESYWLCDGVPKGDGTNCGCWKSVDLDEDRSEWVEYFADGKDCHMCPTCQSKELRVETKVERVVVGGNC